MTISTSSNPGPPSSKNRTRRTRRTTMSRQRRSRYERTFPSALDDAGFWAYLEEREFGRVAMEADHLFDTSFTAS